MGALGEMRIFSQNPLHLTGKWCIIINIILQMDVIGI